MSGSQLQTPVVFMTFNRPEQSRKVFAEIRASKPLKLFFVSDGPRNEGDKRAVEEVRNLASAVDWQCDVTKIFSEGNLGLRNRFFSALDQVFSEVDRAIVLEDDCVPNSDFFSFCDLALGQEPPRADVGIVSGNNFAPPDSWQRSPFLTMHPRIWGWGTWRSTWEAFNKSQTRSFTVGERFRVLMGFRSNLLRLRFLYLLARNKSLNTWDIDFALFLRAHHLWTITPPVNLVENIGLDVSSEQSHPSPMSKVYKVPRSKLPNGWNADWSLEKNSDHEKREAMRELDALLSLLKTFLQNSRYRWFR